MKKTVYFLLLLWVVPIVSAWAQVTSNFTWTASLPARPIAITTDGPRGVYVLLEGNTVVQINTRGQERWRKTFTGWPKMQRITTTDDGQLVLAGAFTGSFTVNDSTYRLGETYETSTFLIGLDSTHAYRWTTYVLTPDGLMSQPITLDTDHNGSIVAFGRRTATGNPFLCRFDTDGRFLGSRVYGGPVVPAPEAVAMVTNSQGQVLLGITERTRQTSSGVLTKMTDESLYWTTSLGESLGTIPSRRFDTSPLDVTIDRNDNTVVLANYTLTDRSEGLRVEQGQVLLRYDASGKNTWIKKGVVRSDSAVARGVLADPAGAFVAFGGYDGFYTPETNQYGTDDYISLAGYSPEGQLRWTTRLNDPMGHDQLIDVVRQNNGSLLLLGSTTGNLTSLSVAGSASAPAYFLTNLQPFELQPTKASSVVLCANGQTTLTGNYTGYFERPITLQLSDAQGSFTNPLSIATVSIGVAGNLFSARELSVTLPVPASIAAGTAYQLRAMTSLPEYIGTTLSVTVAQAPAIPSIQQVGDELVASTTGTTGLTYQWYTNSQQPVTGATSARFRPTQPGAYYAVAQSNGCSSLASEALQFLLLANEPTLDISVYPNPVSDRLLIKWPAAIATNGQIELTDMSGRTVRQQARTADITELSVRDLTTGIYLLNLQADGQPRQVRKVMVK